MLDIRVLVILIGVDKEIRIYNEKCMVHKIGRVYI